MALSRSFLKTTGLTDEQITAVIEEHTAVTGALKAELDKYKTEADKAADLQKKLDDILGGEDWKAKYEDEHQAFEDFKTKSAQEAETAKVKAAYRQLLLDENISEKWLDRVMRGVDFSGMKLNKDGSLADSEKLKSAIDKEWGDVKTTVTERGADVEKPPKSGSGKMTKAEILAIKDTTERQNMIANNLELFGKG